MSSSTASSASTVSSIGASLRNGLNVFVRRIASAQISGHGPSFLRKASLRVLPDEHTAPHPTQVWAVNQSYAKYWRRSSVIRPLVASTSFS